MSDEPVYDNIDEPTYEAGDRVRVLVYEGIVVAGVATGKKRWTSVGYEAQVTIEDDAWATLVKGTSWDEKRKGAPEYWFTVDRVTEESAVDQLGRIES